MAKPLHVLDPPLTAPDFEPLIALSASVAQNVLQAQRMQLEALGVKTVFKQIYPAETTDMTPIVQKYIAAKPDLVFGGTQSTDAYAQVKAMVQQNYSPKFVFFTNGANSPTEFPDKVGANNTEGIFSCGDWFPTSKAPGNPEFVKAYTAKYGGDPDSIDSGSAEAYAVGQVVEDVAAKTKSVDNATIIKTLHSGSYPTIEGNLSWDANGAPKGSVALLQWQGGKLVPVYPPNQALAKPMSPKPPWGG